jgi:hypothetical protein
MRSICFISYVGGYDGGSEIKRFSDGRFSKESGR